MHIQCAMALEYATLSWLLQVLLLHMLVHHAPSAKCQPLKLDEPITYSHHYSNDQVRPNNCKIHHSPKPQNVSSLSGTAGYVPFVGTSLGRDPQQLVLRLYYSTIDYPVKYFIVVIAEWALSPPHGAVWYEVEHLKQYSENAVIIACAHTPSVAEGWNAVFQAFPDEKWGVYCARDTAWMPGSLQQLADHMWNASSDNSIEVALMGWTMDIGLGLYNAFGLTRGAINRFGLFDENIYPAFYEDNDFQLRQERMQPPMKVKVLSDVLLMHGKPQEKGYSSGVHTADDPNHAQQERQMRSFWEHRSDINKAYLLRKWGCQGRNWGGCAYKTPFNKSLPVWYWHTSKHQRALDHGLRAQGDKIVDGDGIEVYTIPKDDNYTGWTGYNESLHKCRVSGPLGVVHQNSSGLWCI